MCIRDSCTTSFKLMKIIVECGPKKIKKPGQASKAMDGRPVRNSIVVDSGCIGQTATVLQRREYLRGNKVYIRSACAPGDIPKSKTLVHNSCGVRTVVCIYFT